MLMSLWCVDLEEQETPGNKFCKVATKKELMDKRLAANEIVAVCGDDSLQRGSIRKLLAGEWLNDEMVNYIHRLFTT